MAIRGQWRCTSESNPVSAFHFPSCISVMQLSLLRNDQCFLSNMEGRQNQTSSISRPYGWLPKIQDGAVAGVQSVPLSVRSAKLKTSVLTVFLYLPSLSSWLCTQRKEHSGVWMELVHWQTSHFPKGVVRSSPETSILYEKCSVSRETISSTSVTDIECMIYLFFVLYSSFLDVFFALIRHV